MSFLRASFRGLPRPTPASARHLHASAVRLALSAAERQRIDDAVHGAPVVVFMKGTPELPMCGFSRAVVQILQVQGVRPEALKTYNVLEDSSLREGIKEYSAWPTIPQLYVKGDFQGGADLALSLHQSGELEEILTKAGVVEPAPQAKA
ncbi:glutaredoxin [Tilletiopsis washingtonensis]|uniref:Monothiol glutaredoxin-5, mitochondrial n=1 Tax=Tilletiopsis washingtonensis TaxID=58919 RepID=A0A316ZA74_9BASI|nr:glutaredoxin [Tilletiopsis washingtonensis]PWN98196.1 glutaredoxin [Tilletiopsis washingtonensis]